MYYTLTWRYDSLIKKSLALLFLLVAIFVGLATWQIYSDPDNNPFHWGITETNPKKELTDFSKATVFEQVMVHIDKNYYDKSRVVSRKIFESSLSALSKGMPEIVVRFPSQGSEVELELMGIQKKFKIPSSKKASSLVPVMQKIFTFIESNYEGSTDLSDLEYAVINGALETLDPHSAILPPKVFKEFRTQTEGEFGGIGIVIGMRDGELTIISPLPGTPAGRAGLKTKDKITQIEDQATINMTLNEAVELMRGKVGTSVKLVVSRQGSSPFQVSLKRAVIKITSVDSELLDSKQGQVGYIKIKSFQEETLRDVKSKLKEMKQSSHLFKGLILDLRNNPGGLLNQAVGISDLFLERGSIVITVGANDEIRDIDEARAYGTEENYPIVVLVNEGSASASEIVSGALKNNDRAIIMGQQTFGKGSVQSVYSLKGDSALKLTIAQYLTPGNQSIQSIGITPDIQLDAGVTDKAHIDLLPGDSFKEEDLEQHLNSKFSKKTQKPSYTLSYFKKFEKPGEEELDEYSNDLNLKDDFSVQLAKNLILSAQSAERKSLLKTSQKIIDQVRAEEESKIGSGLASLGIDWSEGIVTGKPHASISLDLFGESGQTIKTLLAGKKIKVRLTVKNDGDAAFHQLLAQTNSETYLFKNKEFVFGKIPPGESRSWEVEIEVPDSFLQKKDKVLFHFTEANQLVPEDFQTYLEVQSLKSPQFSFQYDLYDDGRKGSRGNGNGKIEVGEKIALDFKVSNIGQGDAKDLVLNLKNSEGDLIFLNKGREKIGELKANSNTQATLVFSINQEFQKKDLELEYFITDPKMVSSLSGKLKFQIGGNKIEPAPKQAHHAPKIHLDALPSSLKASKFKLQGEITDDGDIKDISVFLGENKIYLKSFQSDDKHHSAPFSALLDLEKDKNNLITILVRDHENLANRESFYILGE